MKSSGSTPSDREIRSSHGWTGSPIAHSPTTSLREYLLPKRKPDSRTRSSTPDGNVDVVFREAS